MIKRLLFIVISLGLMTGIAMAQTDSSGKWTKEYRDNFLRECLVSAKPNIGEDSAKRYCSCMVTKLQELYPDQKKADKLTREDFEKPEMKKLAKDCQVMQWADADRGIFLSQCEKNAATLGKEKARKYCDCMLQKMEIKYPTPEDAAEITAEELGKPEWQKLIKACLQ